MSAIADLLAAAEPDEDRPLADLVARLAADGHLVDAGPRRGVVVRGIAYDSRTVGRGSLFVAVPGAHVDGHDFVARAAEAGAAAAIVERHVRGVALPQIVVSSSQRALASAAAWWYRDPSRELTVIGITGTDGKTTTSFLAVAALEAAGVRTGLVGTIETKIGSTRAANPAHATTPEAPALQAALRAMVQAGDKAAIIETTSHGLALGRVDSIAYDVAILTNLTHEHLEFHGTFEAYRAAKLSLFERLGRRDSKAGIGVPKTAIVNVDDPSAALFMAAARSVGAGAIGYGASDHADVHLDEIVDARPGLRVRFTSVAARGEVSIALDGRFNAWNVLAVIALGEVLGLDPSRVASGLGSIERVPGRMERIDAGQPFDVIVDYAHSPASLEAVLEELGPGARGRDRGVIVVLGSAGERDRAKRPMMGRIAGERCRLVVVTDEDPRDEDRETILAEIAAGAEAVGRRRGVDLLLIPDRSEAIAAAFDRARPGDVVLLAGKGHERSIIGRGGVAAPWDEQAAARRALDALGYRGAANADPVPRRAERAESGGPDQDRPD